jgi:hypothetical protein
VIDAQGDFDGGFVDADPVSLLEDNDPRLPGTAEHEGLSADGGTDRDDNEPNGANVDLNLTINLYEGSDLVAPGDAADTIDGGPGRAFLDYAEAGGAVEVDLASGTASRASGNDSVINFEGTSGSVFDDTLLGSGRSNLLAGNCGDDVIRREASAISQPEMQASCSASLSVMKRPVRPTTRELLFRTSPPAATACRGRVGVTTSTAVREATGVTVARAVIGAARSSTKNPASGRNTGCGPPIGGPHGSAKAQQPDALSK